MYEHDITSFNITENHSQIMETFTWHQRFYERSPSPICQGTKEPFSRLIFAARCFDSLRKQTTVVSIWSHLGNQAVWELRGDFKNIQG